MISEKMQAALNEQSNYEMFSGYIYLSMSAFYADLNLPGFANWMRIQAQEELMHAMKFYDYMVSRGARVLLTSIASPDTAWENPAQPFAVAYEHEQGVTARIHNLKALALDERDYATSAMLDWFINEQVEEESNADAIVRQMKLIGDDKSALFMLDRELATRVFVPPTPTAGT